MGRMKMVVGCALIAACQDQTTAPEPIILRESPAFDTVGVSANPNNVLSALISVRVRNADSIVVRAFGGESSASGMSTPPVVVVGDSARIAVFGLAAQSRYVLTPVAFGLGGSTIGASVEFTTAALPPDLPTYKAGGAYPAPGFVTFGAHPYGIVIDNTGRVVWYHRFPNGLGLNFMAQPNGHFTARPPTPEVGDIEPWVEIDPLGNVTRTLTCALGLQPRLHDLIALRDGSYWILCDETRTLDLTELGIPDARVTGTAVQHVAANGTLLFHWSPFDHFTITADDLSDRVGAHVNWTHGNAIDLDLDGNLVVSFRNLGEIAKIDTRTGAVIWRLGGRNNQFTFVGTAEPAFARQHSVRLDRSGALLLLDNLGDPTASRAERYLVDARTMTARLYSSYSGQPGVVTPIGGSVQSVGGQRLLVSFGTAGRVEEHDIYYGLVWQIEGNAGYVFRAQRIYSLYHPGASSSR